METTERPRDILANVDMVSHLRNDTGKLDSDALKDSQSLQDDADQAELIANNVNSEFVSVHRAQELVKSQANQPIVSCSQAQTITTSLVDSEMIQHVVQMSPSQHAMVVDIMQSQHQDPTHSAAIKDAYFTTSAQLHGRVQMLDPSEDHRTIPVSQAYIPDTQITSAAIQSHYDATGTVVEDDLLAHDLTEDDRRLAAALVAVQLVQQQKQQQHSIHVGIPKSDLPPNVPLIVSTSTDSNVIMNAGLPNIMTGPLKVQETDHSVLTIEKPVMTTMVSSYMQHRDDPRDQLCESDKIVLRKQRDLSLQQDLVPQLKPQVLPPLKKVLSQSALRNRFKRPIDEGLGRTELVTQDTRINIPGLEDDENDDELSGEVKEEYEYDGNMSVKSEKDEDDDGDEDGEDRDDDSDEGMQDDSDYDMENDMKSSKKSLPHKKRISRKLKHPKKSNRIHAKCYKCNKCGEQFQTQQTYSAHKLSHIKKPFGCELCGRGFFNQLKFFEHLKSHYEPTSSSNNKKEVTTSISKEDSAKEDGGENNKQQQQQQIVPTTLTCPTCNKTFRRQKAFETHMVLSHNDEVEEELGDEPPGGKEWFPDDMMAAADGVIKSSVGLEIQDSLVVGEPTDHMCDICGENYATRAELNQHVRDEHPEMKKRIRKVGNKKSEHLTCPTCGRMFNHRNSLVYHLRSHTGERPHQCEVCGKSFFAASALKVHMRLHSGDKPYKCEYCGRHFRQWGDLKYHCISIHSDEKQFQCEYCGKNFARKYSLIVHRRIHTGEKNYKCEYCGKSFRASSYLQNHRRIHTGEKPHPCEVCGKPFRVRSDMKRHMQTHNREGHSAQVNTNNLSNIAQTHSITLTNPHSVTPHHNIPDLNPVTEITIQEGPESILPDDSLTQPINLNIVPARSLGGNQAQGTHQQQLTPQSVQEEVLHYARETIDTVRDGTGTLYVWPIYMT